EHVLAPNRYAMPLSPPGPMTGSLTILLPSVYADAVSVAKDFGNVTLCLHHIPHAVFKILVADFDMQLVELVINVPMSFALRCHNFFLKKGQLIRLLIGFAPMPPRECLRKCPRRF